MSDPTSSRARQLANLKPFRPGQSGNPNGRPKKIQTVAQLAEDNSEKALKKLIKLIDDTNSKVALAAAQAVLDRAMGKPKQSLDVGTTKKNAADYDESDLLTIAGMGRAGADQEEEGREVLN